MKRTPLTYIILGAFLANTLGLMPMTHAAVVHLPATGAIVQLSPAFTPAIIRGLRIDPKNPFTFSFLIDRGDMPVAEQAKKEEYQKLIKYFMAAMTVAEDKQWVNLSPYEKNKIIDQDFGRTEMGMDLLAQDFMLKQITASLLYPESELGKQFWNKVYAQATSKYGLASVPVNTFNKVWITPDEASVYEKDGTVLIVKSKLKVQLEEDYLAKQKQSMSSQSKDPKSSQILREIIIPQLTKEVNEGKNFANLRQMYHGMILATWYKQNLKQSILTKTYADQNKVKGVDLIDPQKSQQELYEQYLKAFKKGAYNFIKEEPDPLTGKSIPRKYFSGGYSNFDFKTDRASLSEAQGVYSPDMIARLDNASVAFDNVTLLPILSEEAKALMARLDQPNLTYAQVKRIFIDSKKLPLLQQVIFLKEIAMKHGHIDLIYALENVRALLLTEHRELVIREFRKLSKLYSMKDATIFNRYDALDALMLIEPENLKGAMEFLLEIVRSLNDKENFDMPMMHAENGMMDKTSDSIEDIKRMPFVGPETPIQAIRVLYRIFLNEMGMEARDSKIFLERLGQFATQLRIDFIKPNDAAMTVHEQVKLVPEGARIQFKLRNQFPEFGIMVHYDEKKGSVAIRKTDDSILEASVPTTEVTIEDLVKQNKSPILTIVREVDESGRVLDRPKGILPEPVRKPSNNAVIEAPKIIPFDEFSGSKLVGKRIRIYLNAQGIKISILMSQSLRDEKGDVYILGIPVINENIAVVTLSDSNGQEKTFRINKNFIVGFQENVDLPPSAPKVTQSPSRPAVDRSQPNIGAKSRIYLNKTGSARPRLIPFMSTDQNSRFYLEGETIIDGNIISINLGAGPSAQQFRINRRLIDGDPVDVSTEEARMKLEQTQPEEVLLDGEMGQKAIRERIGDLDKSKSIPRDYKLFYFGNDGIPGLKVVMTFDTGEGIAESNFLGGILTFGTYVVNREKAFYIAVKSVSGVVRVRRLIFDQGNVLMRSYGQNNTLNFIELERSEWPKEVVAVLEKIKPADGAMNANDATNFLINLQSQITSWIAGHLDEIINGKFLNIEYSINKDLPQKWVIEIRDITRGNIPNEIFDIIKGHIVDHSRSVELKFNDDKKIILTMNIDNAMASLNSNGIKDRKDLDLSSSPGGIDLNSANLNLKIKRDGKGIPLPLAQQDMAQISKIDGLTPVILSISPAEPTLTQILSP